MLSLILFSCSETEKSAQMRDCFSAGKQSDGRATGIVALEKSSVDVRFFFPVFLASTLHLSGA